MIHGAGAPCWYVGDLSLSVCLVMAGLTCAHWLLIMCNRCAAAPSPRVQSAWLWPGEAALTSQHPHTLLQTYCSSRGVGVRSDVTFTLHACVNGWLRACLTYIVFVDAPCSQSNRSALFPASSCLLLYWQNVNRSRKESVVPVGLQGLVKQNLPTANSNDNFLLIFKSPLAGRLFDISTWGCSRRWLHWTESK